MRETWIRSLSWEEDPWVGRRERLPTPVFWPGEFHGLYNPWSHKELDTTEWLSLSLSSPAGYARMLTQTCLLTEPGGKESSSWLPVSWTEFELWFQAELTWYLSSASCYLVLGCPVVSNSLWPFWLQPPGSHVHRISQARILEWVCHFLLKGLFLTQGSNPHLLCLLHCRQILHLLRHQGSPTISC